MRHIVEAAAAKAADGRPCATMNGKGGAGSCVKMSLETRLGREGKDGRGWDGPGKMVGFLEYTMW